MVLRLKTKWMMQQAIKIYMGGQTHPPELARIPTSELKNIEEQNMKLLVTICEVVLLCLFVNCNCHGT